MAKLQFDVLKNNDFVKFLFARFCYLVSTQMQSLVVGWQLYEITHDVLSIAWAALFEVIPFMSCALFAGNFADKYNQKIIIKSAILIYLLALAALLYVNWNVKHDANLKVQLIYLLVFITGIARGFVGPTALAFMAKLVPQNQYTMSSTWSSIFNQSAFLLGPLSAGIIYGSFGYTTVYLVTFIAIAISFLLYSFIKFNDTDKIISKETSLQRIKVGFRFFYNNKILMGAISLDMFAVLFGGAVAMLPVFVKEVLHTGPESLGLLRAASSIGGVISGFIIVFFPLNKFAGKKLIVAILFFGLFTILFAFSKTLLWAFVFLLLAGAADNVSVVLRSAILQLYTPNEMRGRLSSINQLFIGTSNEIGSLESSLAARLMGLIPSLVFGGIMSMGITIFVGTKNKKLRELNLNQ